jgi:hypothetical protein
MTADLRSFDGHSKENLWLFEGSSTKLFKLRLVLSINFVLISVSDLIRWSAQVVLTTFMSPP